MPDKFLVGYDGSQAAQRALAFAAERAKAQAGSVIIVHVLEWSPYSFLTPTEIEERHARRKEELARAEQAIIVPAKALAESHGILVETELKYGHIAETICKIAEKKDVSQVIIGRNGHSTFGSRVFGSVAGSLVQNAPVPCTIVP